MKTYFFGDFLSIVFWEKLSEKVLKNLSFGVDFKLYTDTLHKINRA